MPEAKDLEEYLKQDEYLSSSCVLQLTYYSSGGKMKDELECEIQVKTVMGRILPRCSLERGS